MIVIYAIIFLIGLVFLFIGMKQRLGDSFSCNILQN